MPRMTTPQAEWRPVEDHLETQLPMLHVALRVGDRVWPFDRENIDDPENDRWFLRTDEFLDHADVFAYVQMPYIAEITDPGFKGFIIARGIYTAPGGTLTVDHQLVKVWLN